MVGFLNTKTWWVWFAALGPTAIQLHGRGWAPQRIVVLLGLAGLYGMVLTSVWYSGRSGAYNSSKTNIPAESAQARSASGRSFPIEHLVAVSLFVAPLALMFGSDTGGAPLAVLLIGVFTCFVATARFMIIGPLVHTIPAAALGINVDIGIEHSAATVAAAVFGWLAIGQLGLASKSSKWLESNRSLAALPPSIATTTTAIGIGAIAIAAAALITPRLQAPDPIGSGTGSLAGWGITERADLLKRPARGEEIVAWVSTDTPNYWRISTLDHWDGRYWTSSVTEIATLHRGSDGWLDFENDHRWSGGSVPTRFLQESVKFAQPGSSVTFGRPGTFAIHLDRETAALYSDRSIIVDTPFESHDQFSIASRVPIISPALLVKHDPAGGEFSESFRANNLDYSALSLTIVSLAQEITIGATTTYGKLQALEQWFDNNIQYDINSPIPPEGTDPLEFLLLQDKTGYCEQMATSLVLMARSLGIPARMATGFVSNEYRDGTYVVRSKDAHAWAEVYFPEVGWVTFDPTDGTLPVPVEAVNETADHAAANSILQATGVLGIAMLILAGLALGAQRLRKPRRNWLESTIAQIFTLAGERFKMHERYTLADCLTGLAPPGTTVHDDARWLEGLLAGAAYGDTEVDLADKARCKSIIKALRKNPQTRLSQTQRSQTQRSQTPPSKSRSSKVGEAKTAGSDLSRID